MSEERVDVLVRDLAAKIQKKWKGEITATGESFQPKALPDRLLNQFDALQWRENYAPSRADVMGDAKLNAKQKK